MLARVKFFFLSFHSFFLFSMHTSPFTPASGLVRLPLTNCIDDHGSLVIYRFDPTISSIKTSTMITNSNSLFRERDAQSSGRRPTSRHGRFRAFPRSNRIQPTANIANCFATSSTTEQQVFWPWPLWQFFFPGASLGAHTDVASPGCTVRLLGMLPPAKSGVENCPAC